MLISENLSSGLINCNLESTDKDDLFYEMVQMFVREGIITAENRQDAVDALLAREAKMSTGIAEGIAMPHGKIDGIDGAVMALGISHEGIEYDALDGAPVKLVIMMFCEEGNPAMHIEMLSEVSRLLTIPGFSARLMEAQSAEEVLQIIKSEE